MKEQKCPYCGSKAIVKHGFKITVRMGKRQREQCKICAHTFYEQKELEGSK